MLLKNLIDKIPEDKKKIVVSGLSSNSQKIKNNYIFFAIKGNKTNGENYISNAIKNGASVIVCSKSCNYKSKDIFVLKTNKVRNLLSEVSSKFYKLKPKNIIAVTGTNGKTSVADFYYQILRANNIPVGSIGTLGVKYNNKIKKTHLTSPDTISIHKYLNYLKKKNINNVIIETSSHGLHQKRCHNINFKAAIFTNFSQDHLDYHKTMKSYLDAKLILFKEILNKKSTIISDIEIPTFKILKKIASRKNIKIQDIKEEMKKIYNTSSKFDNYKIKNLAMAIKAARLCGLKDKLIIRTIKKIKDVNGRQELVKKYPNNIRVFVDYAHTPDALLKTLESLKNYGKNISLVFGCGGDRDKKKRSLMAKIADEHCKKIYITDDNPRNENPKKIRNQLLKNIYKTKVYNVGNRALAIKKAIKNSSPHEIILVAGKGHEEQQIYKNKINYISDKKIIKKLRIKKRILNKTKQNYIQNKLIIKKMFGKNKFFNFSGLSIDSRTIKNNNLFLTLKGKNSDGKRFIKDALKKGAGCIVSSSNFEDNKKKY